MSTRSQTLASHGDVLDNIPGLLGFPPRLAGTRVL